MMGNIAEKVLCDLNHRQHGLTYFDKSLTLEIKNQMHFLAKGTFNGSSSVTSANAMPTLVITSQVVLIGSLD